MKTLVRIFLFLFFQFLLISHAAAENGNIMACGDDLRNMLLHALPTDRVDPNLYATVEEKHDAVYWVRLHYVVKSGTAPVGMTMGWFHLDTTQNAVYDVTYDDEPKKLAISAQVVRNYAGKCLTGKAPARQSGDNIVTTPLPIRLDAIFDCHHADLELAQCMERYHQYPIDWIDADIRGAFDSSVRSFILLPSLGRLKIVLAMGNPETRLHVFDGNVEVTDEVVGDYSDTSDLRFDINKDYLVTTYLRTGKNVTLKTKISEVVHEKLRADGGVTVCPKSNPACN
jgi:hypothetical protein